MKREWKPGDVAMVTYAATVGNEQSIGLCYQSGVVSRGATGEGVARWFLSDRTEVWSSVTEARPLVVIDPEDREAVERLTNALKLYRLKNLECLADKQEVTDTQAALREFANPKPEEPTGLGAVVEDDEGERWVRFRAATGWWWRDVLGVNCRWADLPAVRVLSEGVQP